MSRLFGMQFAQAIKTRLIVCQIVMEGRVMPMDQGSLSHRDVTSAVQVLKEVLAEEDVNQLQSSGPATVYTTLVTLWMLVLQRLGGGKSMQAVIKDVLASNSEWLPNNKRVQQQTLSHNSAAYSQARKRLRLDTVKTFANQVSQSLIDSSSPWFGHRRAFIIDGTTITLAPTDELRAAFPPATNQHGESVWPVAMLTVAHELQSGCALLPEVGAMYGDHNTSEARQAHALAARIPPESIVLADAGFGIFSVAFHMAGHRHDILFRLTKARFQSLCRKAKLIQQTDDTAQYQLRWVPTAKERRTNPDLPTDAALSVELHMISTGGETLYLVTTLELSPAQAGELYSYRYDVEHDIRDLKVSLNTERIRARSEAMFYKELWTSLVAYNLVIQFRRQAAQWANVPPRRLSFTSVWNTFESYLLHQPPGDLSVWHDRYEHALTIASRDKLPDRPGRSYPRRAHPRRPKSTKFMKQLSKTKTNDEPPPN